MKVMTDEPKVSRYTAAGSPTHCFLPKCRKPFEQACHHGEDGHYYCSQVCADIGSTIDMSHVEELRPTVPPTPSTPKQKIFRR
jgi:hypothetical protein